MLQVVRISQPNAKDRISSVKNQSYAETIKDISMQSKSLIAKATYSNQFKATKWSSTEQYNWTLQENTINNTYMAHTTSEHNQES